MAMSRWRRINRFALGEARTHKRLFTVLNITLGAGCLLQTVQGLASGIYRSNISFIGLGLLLAGGLIGPTVVISVFRELHNRQQSDVVYSLPMSTPERYLSRLMAIVYLHILPVLVWSAVAVIATSIRTAFFDENVRRYVLVTWANNNMILRMWAGYLAGVFFFDSIAVICAVCCGRRAEIRYFTYLLAASFSLAPLLLRMELMVRIGGQATEPSSLFYAWTFSLFIWDRTETMTWLFIILAVVNCLISVGVMLLMYFIYRRRDASSAGKPVVSRAFFEIAVAVCLMTYYTLLISAPELLPYMLVGGVVYLVIHIVTFRGTLSVAKVVLWTVKLGATTAAFVLLLWIAYVTDGFGAARYLPMRNLDNANILIDCSYNFYGGENTVAFVGPDSFFWERNYSNWIAFDSQETTDAQIRQIAEVFQKYASQRDKEFSDFWSFFTGSKESYRGWDRVATCTMNIWFGERNNTMVEQQINLTGQQVRNLIADLKKLGGIQVR